MVNTPYTPFLIGLGKINQLSQEPLFSQMNELELLGFSYARINGWVDNDIMISNSTYDFFRIDLIIKKLLSMNIKPYIEINVYEGLVKKKMLLSRINCLFNHFVSTYGYEEIKGWMVDIVSNKSRDDGLQYVNELSTKEQLEFFELFKEVKSSIKEIVPDIKVGGGGIRLDYFYKPFINDFYSSSKKSNVFPDYLSVSLFQYDKKNSKENDEKFEKKISPDPNFMRRKTADLKKELSLVGFEVNISIVDFNITFSNYDIINDTSFKGTFIIKNILEMMDNCSLIGYGSFFDYSLRNEINYEKEIFGGRGLLSMNGLPKAGYFAFLFMINAFLYKTKKDIDFIISKNEDSSIVNIVMFNYVHLGINYYYDSSTFHKYNIYTAFDGSKETVYNIDLSNIININKKHKVLIKRLGQMHGSFMDEVNKYTNEDNLVQEDIKYLKECIRPVRRIQYLDCEKMKCSIDVKINKHEIVYITIQQI